MLNSASRTSSRHLQGYICHACRSRLLRTHHEYQRRHSNNAGSTQTQTAHDVWESSFNDISESYASQQPKEGRHDRDVSSDKKKKKKRSGGQIAETQATGLGIGDDGAGDSQLIRLVGQLKSDVATIAAQQDEELRQRTKMADSPYDENHLQHGRAEGNDGSEADQDDAKVPFPSFSGSRRHVFSPPKTIDDVPVPAGSTSKLSSAVPDTASSHSEASQQSLSTFEDPADVHDPKGWGGPVHRHAKPAVPSGTTSFASLRKADKRSTEKSNTGKFITTPYGLRPSQNAGELLDSPAHTAESHTRRPAVVEAFESKAADSGEPTPTRFSVSGFMGMLRNVISGQRGANPKDEQPAGRTTIQESLNQHSVSSDSVAANIMPSPQSESSAPIVSHHPAKPGLQYTGFDPDVDAFRLRNEHDSQPREEDVPMPAGTAHAQLAALYDTQKSYNPLDWAQASENADADSPRATKLSFRNMKVEPNIKSKIFKQRETRQSVPARKRKVNSEEHGTPSASQSVEMKLPLDQLLAGLETEAPVSVQRSPDSTNSSEQDSSEVGKSSQRERLRMKRRQRKDSAKTAINEPHKAAPVAYDSRHNVLAPSQAPSEALNSSSLSITEAMKGKPLQKAVDSTPAPRVNISSLEPVKLEVKPLDIPQPNVPYLEYGLDRVLFNPGVYQLQDPASRVYNFDPYLQKIMPVTEFDFNSLKQYKTSSQDESLALLAHEHGKRYIGSTSSMTQSLTHFHYLLSNFRPINVEMLSKKFTGKTLLDTFTKINLAPSSIFLRWKNGTYAIDADKEYDTPNVLMLLGKSMELLLTQPKSQFERYRKSDPRQVSEEEKTAPESYQYTTMGDFLMRSQLDAYDPRLPGNGTFDLKTRAVVSVRMSTKDYEPMTGYELHSLQGKYGSYEREYYDMLRSTMLKYMLQARMGRMSGIFLAYHNVQRIFGFQYISMSEMDRALHGQTNTCLGDQEFRASLDIMNKLFDRATAKFPEQSLRIRFETQQPNNNRSLTAMHCFAEPVTEEEIEKIQNSQKAKIAQWERDIMGVEGQPADDLSTESSNVDNATSDAQSMLAAPDSDLKPLFYATVIVQNQVNGNNVEENRPSDLGSDDKWTLDHLIKEFNITRHEWALYEDLKSRRKFALWDEEDEDGENVEGKKPDKYLDFLRRLSEEGRGKREKIDERDRDRDIVRVDEGLDRVRENIDGVEEYVGWLYGKK